MRSTSSGGPQNAARLLSVKDHRYQTVQSWLRHRVPAAYCPLIERATRELGDPVTCEQLRPDIPWEALRMQSPAFLAFERAVHGWWNFHRGTRAGDPPR